MLSGLSGGIRALACTFLAVLPGAGLGCGSGGHPTATEHQTARQSSVTSAVVPPTSAAKLLGQRIMVGFDGTTPSAALLRSVRLGQVGSVILFTENITSTRQVQALTGALQRAARAGGNPPLLISTDQEGGEVKRFAAGPPSLSPPQIAAAGATRQAFDLGRATGRYLKARGVNMDLAPVLDVPTTAGAFIWQQGRAFSFNANTVAKYATQFGQGLQSAGVAATGKHFPGVGAAGIDTDDKLSELRPTAAQRRAALVPYRALIPQGLDAVMLSVAGFPAYDPSGAVAALSRPMIQGLLRGQLKFSGLTITDALGTPTGHSQLDAGVIAAEAGSDILLYTDSAPGELTALEGAFARGRIGRAAAEASYRRIVALKRKVAG
jgi:beta-N-acetylhexosaminidase